MIVTTAKKVNILGTNYALKFKRYDQDKDFSDRDICGYCDDILKEIVVCDIKTWPGHQDDSDERCFKFMQETLRHEIVHAFLNESGLTSSTLQYSGGWARNEEMVDWIATQGDKIYKAWKEVNAV